MFPQALYHLQQSNEKLAKGLLISYGLLTPKKAERDLRIKSLLGFSPKTPESYRHKVLHSFLSDLEKFVPSIEEWYKLIEDSEFGQEIAGFQITIRKGKKGIQKLKKKPFTLARAVYVRLALFRFAGALEQNKRRMGKCCLAKAVTP
jgi:hypothetical protein